MYLPGFKIRVFSHPTDLNSSIKATSTFGTQIVVGKKYKIFTKESVDSSIQNQCNLPFNNPYLNFLS